MKIYLQVCVYGGDIRVEMLGYLVSEGLAL